MVHIKQCTNYCFPIPLQGEVHCEPEYKKWLLNDSANLPVKDYAAVNTGPQLLNKDAWQFIQVTQIEIDFSFRTC